MKVIQQRLRILIALVIIMLLVSLILFIKGFVIFTIDMRVVFALLLLTAAVLLCISILEYDRYNTAKLIIENKIMHVKIAANEQSVQVGGFDTLKFDVTEYIVSCFGILLGSKVIKFNIDGIKLKEVEIDHNFISIVYGKDNENKTIKLLHGTIEKDEWYDVVEKIRYETGITPNVIGLEINR